MHSTLFKIRQNGYFGFINAEGELVIEPQYLEAGAFQNGFTTVRLNGLLALMDVLGRLYI
nr:WG repeat-containing protein [Saprospiraceae bacterium]